MSQIHFIGAGQMTEAIIRAALKREAVNPDAITLSDIDPERVATLNARYGLSNTQALPMRWQRQITS